MDPGAIGSVLIGIAIVVAFTLLGMKAMKRGGNANGATGTMGSILSMMDPATGAPTANFEAAAAREELKQKRHEATSVGPDSGHRAPYGGKICYPDQCRASPVPR